MTKPPVALAITCQKCHKKFVRPIGSHRVNCETCRPARNRAMPLVQMSTYDEIMAQTKAVAAERPPGRIERATLKELEAIDRSDTVTGSVALRLARDLDGGELTGSQAASLTSQLLKVMTEVRASAPRPADAVDTLSERLWLKRQGQ